MSELKKRYELKVYSNHTVMEGINAPADYVQKANLLGISGIALTDRMTVSGLPELYDAVSNSDFRGIYGAELAVKNDILPDSLQGSFCVSVLAKNAFGLRSLYHLLSAYSKTEQGRISLRGLLDCREHLLIGSGCEQGVFFYHKQSDTRLDAFFEAAEWFDYLEISPDMDEDIVRIISALGEHFGIPVVAVSGARYCYRVQKDHYYALCCANTLKTVPKTEKPLYSAQQMLKTFAYLGEKRSYEVTYDNTAAIADRISVFPLFEASTCRLSPQAETISGALREACRQKFGDPLPGFVKERLNEELTYFSKEGLLGHLQTLYGIMKQMDSAYVTGTYAGTLVAYLLGISKVDPLPEYLHCSKCGAYTLLESASKRLHMASCPQCGTLQRVRGCSLPFSFFTQSSDHDQLSAVCSQKETQMILPRLEKMFSYDNFAQIGTFRTMPFSRFRKFYKQLNREHDECMPPLPKEEGFDSLSNLGGGVGLFASDQAQYLITPSHLTVWDVTALCREQGSRMPKLLTSYGIEDLHSGGYPVLKFVVSESASMLERLKKGSAFTIEEDTDYISEAIGYLRDLTPKDFIWLPEEYLGYLLRLTEYYPIESFEQLIGILSIGHGSKLWIQNFDRLVENKTVRPDKIFTNCEDLYELLRCGGIDENAAYAIVDLVRDGSGETVIDEQTEREFARLGFPDWLAGVLRKIRHLHPKGYAIAEADILCRLLWYRLHDEKLYRKVCLKGW